MSLRPTVTIVGGGASGMMAAISAARAGADVTLLERMPRVGKKLLATGNGRCNLTNVECPVSRYHGGHRDFVARVLGQFTVDQTLAFFESLGIACKTEEEGKVYPRSDQASAVLDVLRYELEQQHVTAGGGRGRRRDRSEANRVHPPTPGSSRVHRVACCAGQRRAGRTAIREQWIRVSPCGAARAQRDRAPAWHRVAASGRAVSCAAERREVRRLRSRDAQATRVLRREAGEILFTDYGISGPPVLQVSRAVLAASASRVPVCVALDLFPELTREQLEERLVTRFRAARPEADRDGARGAAQQAVDPGPCLARRGSATARNRARACLLPRAGRWLES